MGQSSDGHASDPSRDSIDALIRAIAAAPPRAPPSSGAFASPFGAGKEVGRYRLVRELGRGGMGSVWEATHRVSGKRVALKIVRDGLALTPQLKQRFEREAQLVTAVGHPGVVDVHDLFDAGDGWPVLVMELLSGETLGSWLGRERRPITEVARVLADVMAIVIAAHRAGVIHRDLKPENIFLCDASSAGPRVRVLDFGIARLVDGASPAGGATLTDTGTLLGTPQYMAPEQLFGERDVDERADVWALGVILYEGLVGERPIKGSNLGQIVRSLSEGGVPRLNPPAFPKAICGCVRAMLEQDKALRVRDLGAVARTLEAVARGECASSSERHGGVGRWIRRTAPLLVVAAVAASVFVFRGAPWSRLLAGGTGTETLAGSLFASRASLTGGAAARTIPSSESGSLGDSRGRELTLATLVPRTSNAGRVLDAFRRSVSLRTSGQVNVILRWPGTTGFRGGQRALLSGLRTGQVDGAALSARLLPEVYRGAAAVQLPGIVDSWTKVDWIRERLREPMRAGFEREGYRLLAWQDEGCERLMSRGAPVKRLADLSGRRLAVFDADTLLPALYALIPGSVSVSLGDSDVGEALGRGSRLGVSVVLATAGEAERLNFAQSLEQMTLMPVSCRSGALVLRASAYGKLDPDAQAAVDELAGRLENEAASRARQDDTAASLRLRKSLASIEPTAQDRREWRRFFARAAMQSTRGVLPQTLVDEVVGLGSEIDALE